MCTYTENSRIKLLNSDQNIIMTHYIIHQHALYKNVLKIEHVTTIVIHLIYYIIYVLTDSNTDNLFPYLKNLILSI